MPQTPQTADPSFFILPLLIFLIFYFIVIRPVRKQEKRREKELKDMLANLAKNDEVVTTGGIHATVANVKDKTVILRIDENVKIEIEKNCIAYSKKTADANKEK